MNLDIDLMLQILIQVDDVHAHSVSHLRLTLCNPMDYSPPDSSVHGIFQARILERVAISSSSDLPNSGIKPRSPALQADSLSSEPHRKPLAYSRQS